MVPAGKYCWTFRVLSEYCRRLSKYCRSTVGVLSEYYWCTVGLVPETAVGLSDQAALQVMAMRVAAEMQVVAMQAAVAAGWAANP